MQSWKICAELRQIVQIKSELKAQKLLEHEPDPDTGYSMHDICLYEDALLKEFRSRFDSLQ